MSINIWCWHFSKLRDTLYFELRITNTSTNILVSGNGFHVSRCFIRRSSGFVTTISSTRGSTLCQLIIFAKGFAKKTKRKIDGFIIFVVKQKADVFIYDGGVSIKGLV